MISTLIVRQNLRSEIKNHKKQLAPRLQHIILLITSSVFPPKNPPLFKK